MVGNLWECEVGSRIWKENKSTFKYIVTIYFLRPLKSVAQCVESILGISSPVLGSGELLGQQQRVLTGSTCSAASIPP